MWRSGFSTTSPRCLRDKQRIKEELEVHPLVVKDESLYKQIHGCRTNSRNLKRGDYHTLNGLFGRFVENTLDELQEVLGRTLFGKD